jgi:hypothetical protein
LAHRFGPAHTQSHRYGALHRAELEASTVCGYFYCFAAFALSEVTQWIDNNQTALCPKCEIDSVIGSASGYPITRDFLMRMHEHWF